MCRRCISLNITSVMHDLLGGGILVGSYPSAWKDGNKVVSYIYKHYQLQHIFLYDKEIGNRSTNKLPNESVFV